MKLESLMSFIKIYFGNISLMEHHTILRGGCKCKEGSKVIFAPLEFSQLLKRERTLEIASFMCMYISTFYK